VGDVPTTGVAVQFDVMAKRRSDPGCSAQAQGSFRNAASKATRKLGLVAEHRRATARSEVQGDERQNFKRKNNSEGDLRWEVQFVQPGMLPPELLA